MERLNRALCVGALVAHVRDGGTQVVQVSIGALVAKVSVSGEHLDTGESGQCKMREQTLWKRTFVVESDYIFLLCLFLDVTVKVRLGYSFRSLASALRSTAFKPNVPM